jgi:SAM-dependent methyltransferase
MSRCIATYLPKDRRYVVVDLGSGTNPKRHKKGMTHRSLLADHDCEIIGVDVRNVHNVDVVMEKPYRLPFRSNSIDVILSGQVFEHIPFFWATMLEVSRVLRRGGLMILTVPSRGHEHTPVDCWRCYPDGVRAMAAFAGLEVREASTDFPPMVDGRHAYADIDTNRRYWGDTVGVLEKTRTYPSARLAVARPAMRWWANRASARMTYTC